MDDKQFQEFLNELEENKDCLSDLPIEGLITFEAGLTIAMLSGLAYLQELRQEISSLEERLVMMDKIQQEINRLIDEYMDQERNVRSVWVDE